jgi:hypothetical protein
MLLNGKYAVFKAVDKIQYNNIKVN